MTNYYCGICSKNYASYNSLWGHNKRYHSTIDTKNKSVKQNKKIVCNICNKEFGDYSNRNRHQKKCNQIETELQTNASSISLDKQFELIKDLIPQVLQNQTDVMKLVTENLSQMNNSHNQTQQINESMNNNNSNNSNINSNNINITISLGNENILDTLTAQEQLGILKQKKQALEAIIKTVHFNKKYPQFHNIAITGEKGYQFDDKEKKFIEISIDELLTDVIENRVNDLYELNQENQVKLSKKTHDYIKAYTNTFNIEYNVKRNMEKIEPIIYSETQKLLNNKDIKIEEIN